MVVEKNGTLADLALKYKMYRSVKKVKITDITVCGLVVG